MDRDKTNLENYIAGELRAPSSGRYLDNFEPATGRVYSSGLVSVNTWMVRDLRTPMGGVKQSGVGREGGFEALGFFTEAKNVCIQYG